MKRAFVKLWNWVLSLIGKAPKKQQKQLIGRQRVPAGVVVWECDLVTGDIHKANVIEYSFVDRKGRSRIKREVVLNQNCIYDYAINGENAVRKFESRIMKYAQSKKV